jgi:hypothetical protein
MMQYCERCGLAVKELKFIIDMNVSDDKLELCEECTEFIREKNIKIWDKKEVG